MQDPRLPPRLVSELEGMARRNPLGTIAGALLVGVIIGMISRGRG
jgi:hypothetical protein